MERRKKREKRGARRRRGFTLIELAIALAVIGLLLGAALTPMRMLEERRQVKDEIRRMERVRDAIVGYALRHRTRARVIKFVTLDPPHSEWEFRLPAGRPYLPCPDWDGDGFEDRLPEGREGFMQGIEVKPDLKVTATIGAFSFGGSLTWWSKESYGGGGGPWYPYGECRVLRGTVPWRTLGIPPADGWGNRHTYFADPVFSNAIFGFDRQTIADIYDPRVPDAQGFIPAIRRRFAYSRLGHDDPPCPAAICDGARTNECTTSDSSFGGGRFEECAWHEKFSTNISFDSRPLILKAGAITKEAIGGRKYFPPRTVTDGLPFVLVSHGPNGRFAVNHWASLNEPLDVFGVKRPICNIDAWKSPTGGVNPRVPRDERVLIQEAMNGTRIASSSEMCSRVSGYLGPRGGRFSFNLSFFVWEPPGTSDKSGFDDLLVWMTRGELSGAVRGDIPPLPPMVIAYFVDNNFIRIHNP